MKWVQLYHEKSMIAVSDARAAAVSVQCTAVFAF